MEPIHPDEWSIEIIPEDDSVNALTISPSGPDPQVEQVLKYHQSDRWILLLLNPSVDSSEQVSEALLKASGFSWYRGSVRILSSNPIQYRALWIFDMPRHVGELWSHRFQCPYFGFGSLDEPPELFKRG